MKNPISIITGLCLALLMPALVAAGDPIDELRDMPEDGQVSIENMAGSVQIETWDRAAVEIRGELGDDVEEFEVAESSNGVRIRVRNEHNSRSIDGTDLRLRIPAGADIEIETVSADIDVSGSRGKIVQINSVSGDIDVEGSPQRIDLNSVSGDVEFIGEAGRSSVETVSGEITLTGLSGEIVVSTVSGDVSLIDGDFDQARFEAVSGDLQLELKLRDGGRLTSDSMSGDLMLRVPSDQQARFSAQTFSGSIRSDFGKSARVARGPGSMLEYDEGSNGATIRLESFSGDIQIRRK
jgi:DUF4097 and DUF4098 domain-containing protein YvlB